MRVLKTIIIVLVITIPLVIVGLLLLSSADSPNDYIEPAKVLEKEAVEPPTRKELLELVNKERRMAGVAPLVIDDRLNKSAQYKADDMVKYNYRAHVNPKTGMHGYEYINQVGIYCKTDSENLTWDSKTAKESFNWWVHSKPHHLAMINKSYSLTGFGIAEQESYYFIVEHFCQV